MSHLEPRQASSIAIYPLSSSSSQQAMTVFTRLFSSCAGPFGKNHIVRNACGGHLTITSTCIRLLSSICISRSELKLVVSAVNGHLQQSGDCGLFMTHMCLELTKSALELNVHHSVASSTFLSFVSIILDYIKSDNCDVRVKADFSSVNLLLSFVQSVLNSKMLLTMRPEELNNLSLTVLNAFVKAIPSIPCDGYSSRVFIFGQEKVPISKCKCENGLIIEFPELLFHKNPDELITKMRSKSCEKNERETCIKVALVTCSMSGDMEDVVQASYEGTNQQFRDLEDCVFNKMTSLCKTLEEHGVALLLCQKVIHPKLKSILRSNGIVYVDRLGSQPIPYIRDLTGSHPISSMLQNIKDEKQFTGKLTAVSPYIENNKGYIHLKNDDVSVVTLVLCSELEESLSELKCCVSAALKGLGSLAKDPWLLMGGGCWQMHCSQILKERVLSTSQEMCEKLSCSESVLLQLLKVFRSCLHKWCLGLKNSSEHLSFDTSAFHSWRVPKNISRGISDVTMKQCSCGFKAMPRNDLRDLDITLMQEENFISKGKRGMTQSNIVDVDEYGTVVLDSFTACLEALHKGVMTTGLLLSIGQFICDRN